MSRMLPRFDMLVREVTPLGPLRGARRAGGRRAGCGPPRALAVLAALALAALALVALALVALLAGCGVSFGASGGSGTTVASGKGVSVHVKVVTSPGGATLVLLPVTINGHGPYMFALDTGATASLIDTPLAQQLHLPQNGQGSQINGVSGNEQAVPVAVKSWSVEQLKLPPMTVASANLFASQRGQGLKGLIGSDVWNQFGDINLNYNQQTLTVPKPIAGTARGQPAIAARDPRLTWRQKTAV